jgi:hypothetical protein
MSNYEGSFTIGEDCFAPREQKRGETARAELVVRGDRTPPDASDLTGRRNTDQESLMPMPTKTCPECGTSFTCGSDSPEPCWCASLPQIVEMTLGRDCLCPACLTREIESRVQLHQLECAKASPFAVLKRTWMWWPVTEHEGRFTLDSPNVSLSPADMWGGQPPVAVDVYASDHGKVHLARYPEGALVSLETRSPRGRRYQHWLCEPAAIDECLEELGVEGVGERGA